MTEEEMKHRIEVRLVNINETRIVSYTKCDCILEEGGVNVRTTTDC